MEFFGYVVQKLIYWFSYLKHICCHHYLFSKTFAKLNNGLSTTNNLTLTL